MYDHTVDDVIMKEKGLVVMENIVNDYFEKKICHNHTLKRNDDADD